MALNRPLIGSAIALAGCAGATFVLAFTTRSAERPPPRARAPAPVIHAGPTGRTPLSGPWFLRLDATRAGLVRGGFAGQAVHVPYSPNARHVTGERGQRSYDGAVAWYRTRLRIVATGDYAIRFESVNHHATVWLDGREVARHTGTYLPFEARARLTAGIHELVVRADWRDPRRLKAQGWHRTWFNFGGINREVTLRRLGASELDAPGLVTRLQGDAAVVDVTVRVRNRRGPRSIAVVGTLGDTRVRFPPVRLAAGATAWVRARARIERPKLWQPGRPALYPLRLAVPGESGYVARVGLRELSWSGGRLFVNGRPLLLRGASLQEDALGRGDALLPGDMDAVVERLRALNANATRSQHPVNPALLERLDAAGILIWQGVGPVDQPGRWSGVTPRRMRTALRRVRRSVLQARAHPSVLAWNLINEVDANGAPGGQREYVEQAAREVHALDPGRPAALDVWGTHLPARAGRIYAAVDVLGVTNYEGWYASILEPGRVVGARIRAWLRRVHATFPGVPIVITEFGAEANRRNPSSAPGGLDFQADLLARHIRIYRSDPRLSGMLVWNLQDFAIRPSFFGGSVRSQTRAIRLQRGINAKGLFTYGGDAKPAAHTVARLYRGGR